MAVIQRFRSLWGILPGDDYTEWKRVFPQWKAAGYFGIEYDFSCASDEALQQARSIADSSGLEISAQLHSAWADKSIPRPRGLTPAKHLEGYREQLTRAKTLRPIRVNAHSGADFWTMDEAVDFYKGTLEIDEELGFAGQVTHETHRNRGLYSPYVTDYVLQRVPQLKITGDFSHWVVVCERLFDLSEEDKELLDRVIPHVYHLHARIGTTQSTQVPDPIHSYFTEERNFFETLWLRIIESRIQRDPQAVITFVPEYGPAPYLPFGTTNTHSELADSEGLRLEKLFKEKIGT